MSQPRSLRVATPEVDLHVLDWGDAAAPPVVMVHGINVQAHTWDPISRELARDRRVITPDLRGHGESSWPRSGYRIASFVEDLAQILDHLGLEKVDLVGHSLGARITIAFAAEHPDRVSRLALSDTGPEVARGGGEFSRDIVAQTQDVRGFRNAEEARAHYLRLHPEWVEEFIDLHVEHQLRENWAGKLIYKADPDLFWLTGSAGARENDYLWQACERIPAPVLIMWGTRSPFFNDEIADRMLAALPHGRLVRMEAGHYLPREVPDLFIEELRTFLDTPIGELTND